MRYFPAPSPSWTALWGWRATAPSRERRSDRSGGGRSQSGAVDATCCRIMGLDPARIGYLVWPPANRILAKISSPSTGGRVSAVASRPAVLPGLGGSASRANGTSCRGKRTPNPRPAPRNPAPTRVSARRRALPDRSSGVAILVPCFWQPYIESRRSRQPHPTTPGSPDKSNGQSSRRQRDANASFDQCFIRLGPPSPGIELGRAGAERIVVSAAVEIFFWGAFCFFAPWRATLLDHRPQSGNDRLRPDLSLWLSEFLPLDGPQPLGDDASMASAASPCLAGDPRRPTGAPGPRPATC